MYIYGKNVMDEVLSGEKPIFQIYLYRNFKDKSLLELLNQKQIPIRYVDKTELDRMVKGNHQGIIASVPDYHYFDLSELIVNDNAFVVLLDHIEDPHNFGAIIRTCEAAGVDGIIIPKDRSVDVSGTVMKVSAGALENIKVSMVTNISSTIKELKQKGFWIIGTDMIGTPYDQIDYRGKIAIVIGNEGNGMSRMTKEHCDFIASIPMQGKINSLNASVATGIVIFEALKNRK